MIQNVRELSDEMLIQVLDTRVELEHMNEAEIVDFIREVKHRKLYLKYGAESAYDFLTRAHFHYAPAVAQRKLDAARVLQDFPDVKARIAEGEINLTQLGMFEQSLRQKPASLNTQREVLELIRGQTVSNTQFILSEKLGLKIKSRTKARVQRDGSVRVEMTFSAEDWALLNRAKEVLSHSIPSGELTEVIAACARFTVQKKDPATSVREVKPRQCVGISRADRRRVFLRDRSCRHIHADGRVCGSRYQLQVDHIVPLWADGTNELANLQLLCGVHNRYKYELETQESDYPSETRTGTG